MNYIVELIDNMSSKTADHLRANPLVIAHCIGAMKIITAISIAKDSHVSMISRALFAPCKGLQHSFGFWLPHCGFWIPGNGFRILVSGTWILDSTPWILDSRCWFWILCRWNLDPGSQSLVGFQIPITSGIPDSLCCIPDSKAQDSAFHSKNLLDFGFQKQKHSRIPKHCTLRKIERSVVLSKVPSTWFLLQN